MIERAAQVAVREHAEQPVAGLDDGRHAEALARHLDERVVERRVARDLRHLRARVHDVGDVQQEAAAEAAGRMRAREVFGA